MILQTIAMDWPGRLSRHDVRYGGLCVNSWDGLPIGNGRMGGIVQAVSTGLQLQVNRPDVLGVNCFTNAPVGTHHANACGRVEIDLGPDAFPPQTVQRLRYHEALGSVEGSGIAIEIRALPGLDVMVFRIVDSRENPTEIRLRLHMLREPVRTVGPGPLSITSSLLPVEQAVALRQVYHEPGIDGESGSEHYCASALLIGAIGAEGHQAINQSERTIELRLAPDREHAVLLASAATLDPACDIVAAAAGEWRKAAGKPLAALESEHKRWWAEFWGCSRVALHSSDNRADYLERCWVGWLYSMGCCSRSWIMPHWNCLLWRTSGDWEMSWSGARVWGENLLPHYRGILAANHAELAEPYFNGYSLAVANGARHAAEVRGSPGGVYISETTYWNGSRPYPPEIARELSEVLLERLTWEETSQNFKDFAHAHLPCADECFQWVKLWVTTGGKASWLKRCDGESRIRPYTFHSHCFSTSAKIAWRFWLGWEFSRDFDFLRDKAWPIIRGVAELYRNYPNVFKGEDGKYHIRNLHSLEPLWAAQDPVDELCGMKAIAALAVRASEILGVDEALRPLWRDLSDNAAPLATTTDPDAVDAESFGHVLGPGAPEAWADGRRPFFCFHNFPSLPTTRACTDYDLLTLATRNPAAALLAEGALRNNPWFHDLEAGKGTYTLSLIPMTAVMMGQADRVRRWLPAQLGGVGWRDHLRLMRNNIMVTTSDNKWFGNISMENMGQVSHMVQESLLQSVAPAPGGDPVIHVFPAWPREWDGAFTLAARGGFLVSAAMQGGEIRTIEIESRRGGICRIASPWSGVPIVLHRAGEAAPATREETLCFDTTRGERVLLLPEGVRPDTAEMEIPVPAMKPWDPLLEEGGAG